MQSTKQLIKKISSVLATKPKPFTRPFTVIVEGNMGSGKTTFLEHFQKHQNVCVLAEPVEFWRNLNGYNLLQLMYQDPKTWSFTFQSYVQLSMLENHLKLTSCPVKLMERSIYSARYCFVEKLAKDGLLTGPAYQTIDAWFKFIQQRNLAEVDLIVYLRTSPEVVYERILKRNRSEEKTVSLDYVKSLHEMHEDWLYRKTIQCPAPTLILDGNKERSVIEAEFEKWEPQILSAGNL